MKHLLWPFAISLALAGPALAQTARPAAPAAPPAPLSDHAKQDILKHRAMAAAHESAARCFEAGKPESTCHAELEIACTGLALGKLCGMRHEH